MLTEIRRLSSVRYLKDGSFRWLIFCHTMKGIKYTILCKLSAARLLVSLLQEQLLKVCNLWIKSMRLIEGYPGFGVGNASASATHALLLTVLQDAFSRLTSLFVLFIFSDLR